jgi:hypothetical protein
MDNIFNMLKQQNRKPSPPQPSYSAYYRSTNIQFPQWPAAQVRPELPTNIPYFVLDSATGKIQQVSSTGEVLHEFASLQEFKAQYDLPNSYFPFVFDTQKPNQLILGVGAESRDSTGNPIANTLVRNGGHYQLARQYRGNSIPDLNGLFGGGVRLSESGDPQIELTSRSVNQTVDGALPADADGTLREAITKFF